MCWSLRIVPMRKTISRTGTGWMACLTPEQFWGIVRSGFEWCRSNRDEPEDFRTTDSTRRCTSVRRLLTRARDLHAGVPWRQALGDFQKTVPGGRDEGKPGQRRLFRRAGHRIWSGVDHRRPGLCAIPRSAMASSVELISGVHLQCTFLSIQLCRYLAIAALFFSAIMMWPLPRRPTSSRFT